MTTLTHLNAHGQAHMVEVGDKPATHRVAIAQAQVRMAAKTLAAIIEGEMPKGDVLAVARIAGIQAAKKCADLIPLCHPLALTGVTITLEPDIDLPGVRIEARCRVNGQTGVEMEALTGASIAALTIYDMCKAIDRAMSIEAVQLLEKSGGQSGDWQRATSC